MAHFAKLGKDLITILVDEDTYVTGYEVLQVIVVNNSELLDENGNESEEVGITFCKSLFGEDTSWKQTSYNSNFRGVYAGIGFVYDPVADVFASPVAPEMLEMKNSFPHIEPAPLDESELP